MRNQSTQNKYYVYIWFVIESYEIFYIGKGSGNRARSLKGRNKFFRDMYDTHNCDYHIIAHDMPENVAFALEKQLIAFVRCNLPHFRLTNICDGGEGVSGWIPDDAYREHMRYKNLGSGNPNYHNWWSDEQRKKLSEKLKASGARKGAKNSKAKPVMCVETGVVYTYISEALQAYRIKDHSNMSAALSSFYRTAGGMHWVCGDMIQELDTEEKRMMHLQTYRRRTTRKLLDS